MIGKNISCLSGARREVKRVSLRAATPSIDRGLPGIPVLTVPLLAALVLLLISCGPPAENKTGTVGSKYFAYFGAQTQGDGAGKGIYAYRFDADTGELSEIGLVAEMTYPAFLAVHPSQQYLYAVTADEEGRGAVRAFKVDRMTGKLNILNQVLSGGAAPVHLDMHPSGRMLAVANYRVGSTSSLPVNQDGSLGEAVSVLDHYGSSVDPSRQSGPHAHSVNFSPDGRFAVSADLGTDDLFVFRADPGKALLEFNDPAFAEVAPGSGPRHLTFHPSAPYCYVINEMNNTVTAFHWDAEQGALEIIQTLSTLPEGYNETSYTAEVLVHPSGKYLYGSNRGHESIVQFEIDPVSGLLTVVGWTSTQGAFPRNFNFDPSGAFLFAENQHSSTVVVFGINPLSGELTPTGQVLAVPQPACLRWVKAAE